MKKLISIALVSLVIFSACSNSGKDTAAEKKITRRQKKHWKKKKRKTLLLSYQ